jgi:hypothetical protein
VDQINLRTNAEEIVQQSWVVLHEDESLEKTNHELITKNLAATLQLKRIQRRVRE